MEAKRYVVFDFSIGNPVMVDCMRKTMIFYNRNLYGQIYNIRKPKIYHIGANKINGLIRRTHNPSYGFYNSKAVDGFIYNYIMTPEQQAQCENIPVIFGWNKFISASDNFAEVIKNMCEWVYEHEYTGDLGDKNEMRDSLLKYCREYVAEINAVQNTRNDVNERSLQIKQMNHHPER